MGSSFLGEIQALSRTLVDDAARHSEAAAAAVAARAAAQSLAASSNGAGREPGRRLFLETEKLQVLCRVLQAIHDAAPANEPRSLAFAPSGMYLTVSVPLERRCHALSLPDFFFAKYRCAEGGFRMIVDLPLFIGALTKIYSTHRGRCVQLLDQANNTLLIRSRGGPATVQVPATLVPTAVPTALAAQRQNAPKTAARPKRPSPVVSATQFEEGHVETGNDGRPWRVSVTKAGVYRWAPLHTAPTPDKPLKKKAEPGGVNAIEQASQVAVKGGTKKCLPSVKGGAPDAKRIDVKGGTSDGKGDAGASIVESPPDGMDGRGKVGADDKKNGMKRKGAADAEAKLEDNRFFETVLLPIAPDPVANGAARSGAGARCERIPECAYTRFPRMVEVGSEWMHNIFKRLQQHARIGFEFDGEKRLLQFTSTLDGAPCREGDIIPPHRILPNPFLQPLSQPTTAAAAVVDTRTVVVTRDVAEPASDAPAARDRLTGEAKLEAERALNQFKYRADFAPSALWRMLKTSKLCAYLHLYFAPNQPLVMQYVLQRDKDDSRRAATYSTWVSPLTRQPNPHVKMPPGGAATVTRKMLELAPRLGSTDHTFRVCTQAIQLTGGSAPVPSVAATAVKVVKPVVKNKGDDDNNDDDDESASMSEDEPDNALDDQDDEEGDDARDRPTIPSSKQPPPKKLHVSS